MWLFGLLLLPASQACLLFPNRRPARLPLPDLTPQPIEQFTRVRFELFPGNGDEVEPITFDGQNLTLAQTTKFEPSKPMKVVIHGWEESSLVDGEVLDQNHYPTRWAANYDAASMDYTVLGVHWVPLTGWGLENADPGSEDAAQSLSLILYAFARDYNLHSENIHLIGFSMGTAVASKTAQKVQSLGMRRLARVTLLDPCPAQAVEGIATSDGILVEAIHTSTFGICSTVVDAHTNTYVNGGQAQVCGSTSCSCADGSRVCDTCYQGRTRCGGGFEELNLEKWLPSHMRAPELYLQSILAPQGRGKSFLSWKCALNYTQMIANEESCPFTSWASLVPMGEDSLIRGRPKEGIYFLKTTGEEPYSYSSYLA